MASPTGLPILKVNPTPNLLGTIILPSSLFTYITSGKHIAIIIFHKRCTSYIVYNSNNY